jgi:hypothetical protein
MTNNDTLTDAIFYCVGYCLYFQLQHYLYFSNITNKQAYTIIY